MIRTLPNMDEEARKATVLEAWDQLGPVERFIFNKLLTGGWRVGISQKLMTRALAQATGQDEAVITHKLRGNWTPDTTTYHALIEAEDPTADLSRPYPFYLAYQLEGGPETLENPSDWRAERKWDGIRGQMIVRAGEHHLWSRGEDLMTDRFPEFAVTPDFLPDGTVIDGEVLAWADDAPLSFNALQKRIGRKTVPKKLLAEAPVILKSYDLLEFGGEDWRDRPFDERRSQLETLVAGLPPEVPVKLSPLVAFDDWDTLTAERKRSRICMPKARCSNAVTALSIGSQKGDWWKWKVDLLVIDAVMIYAQAGMGGGPICLRISPSLFGTATIWSFTKAYSGLTDAEFREITSWVRKNTQQRFGPVRQVTPHHVFEIAFEGIQESPRHKSGVALRFPRMSRWRKDKPLQEANTLDDLNAMLRTYG